jgi:hypothetical protein
MTQNIKAQCEQVVIDMNVSNDALDPSAVPVHGTVIAVGDEVDTDQIAIGDVVLLPHGNIKNVPDPRIVKGEMKQDDPERRLWAHTHYKNIAVVYKGV